MTEHERLEKLQQIADQMTQKLESWVSTLEPETAGPQAMRQICGTLKDLKELSRDLHSGQSQGLMVTIAGGEESWSN